MRSAAYHLGATPNPRYVLHVEWVKVCGRSRPTTDSGHIFSDLQEEPRIFTFTGQAEYHEQSPNRNQSKHADLIDACLLTADWRAKNYYLYGSDVWNFEFRSTHIVGIMQIKHTIKLV